VLLLHLPLSGAREAGCIVVWLAVSSIVAMLALVVEEKKIVKRPVLEVERALQLETEMEVKYSASV